ncbi:MAG: riboflavin synthase [Bacteroidetes bacterium]|nr:riboflavin synthase [Bacteroidota bacterium]
MFTGIIETTGKIEKIERHGGNCSYWVSSSLYNELKPDQSLSHNGVCLTVEAIEGQCHKVTAIKETLEKTNLTYWQIGAVVNLERCMQLNGRLDGHIVQGHVDTTAICIGILDKLGSWEYQFEIDKKFSTLIIEKGSITLNGISLTIFNITASTFSVAIVPYTFEHTNMRYLKINDTVNIEFDMIGKYVNRISRLK